MQLHALLFPYLMQLQLNLFFENNPDKRKKNTFTITFADEYQQNAYLILI